MTGFTNSVVNIFSPQGAIRFIELTVFITMVIYSFLAFLLTRQVKLMNQSFTTPYKSFFTLVAFVHFVAAGFLTIIAYFVI